jgi:hypothetical protein
MYRVTLACTGVPQHEAQSGAQDIVEEFTHRRWYQNVNCNWDGVLLLLSADSDFDSDGRALSDEFSDALSACISTPFDADIEVVSIVEV